MVDPAALRSALEEKLRALTSGDARVDHLQILAGGASQEMWRLDAHLDGGDPRGDYRLVLRRQLGGKIYRDALDLAREFHVMQVAYAAEVSVPYPQAFLPDLLGRPAALVHWHAGETIARRIVRDSVFATAREKLPAQMGAMLARIHHVDIEKYALREFLPHPPPRAEHPADPAPPGGKQPGAAESDNVGFWKETAFTPYLRVEPAVTPAQWTLAQLERNLDEIGEPHPALELGLRWLRRNAPPTKRLTFLHGDYRLGNMMVNAGGLVSVLDWEFAHLGDPYEDLAWSLVRDWRFGNDALRFAGIAQPDEFFAGYARAGGFPVDEARVHYWEVMGNVRWGVGMLNQAQRHLRGEEPNLEFASLGRRCAELELEILRLIRA